MTSRALAFVLFAAAAALVQDIHAEPRWRDPFARQRSSAPAPASSAEPLELPAAAREPELRAILFDQGKSLVNISGRIVAVGETVSGYRLVRVDERSALLSKGGKRIKLTLDKDVSR